MAQKLIQTQEQKQVQVQRLTQQQMMLVKMLEMPLTELEQSVSAELDDNPALESCDPDKMDDANGMMDMHDGAEALADEADGDGPQESSPFAPGPRKQNKNGKGK